MGQKRRKITIQEKVKILREHYIDKVPLSQLCDRHQIHPTMFYKWQQTLFEHGAASFEAAGKGRNSQAKKHEKEVETLQSKLNHKDQIIAELVEHNIDLKKKHGRS